MSSPLLLNGHAEFRDETPALRREIERLVSELRRTEGELKQAQNEALAARQATGNLRRLLAPLWGEVQALGGDSAVAPITSDKWEFWKKRFPGRIAEAIDLLLVQKQMNSTQLKSALKCDPRTLAKSVIYPLNQAGLLIKNGGMFSLKEI